MGVKSLWNLLEPVGRPVPLETMEGKSMAIDSSIWIYQFQATMRDKEGRGLVNAHVVGFLRRICKLLFFGIKPVFVFDGGAPVLKRSTIAERKNKKSGAAASHAKVAERLLAAQMRREALTHIQKQSSSSTGRDRVPSGPAVIDENTVYLEDLDSTTPKTPSKERRKIQDTPPSSSKKSRWRDHDPYRLPEVDLDAVVAKVTNSNIPDPRLATEDELRAFIDEMKPEDFDVHSPAFRELPTEVQYEIIGDMRLKSRQTSYIRLQNMLRKSKTPLDFSKEQIKNLKQRNSLTQQLLTTTDSIGKAHVEIPIRIASERNKQYLLIKNEGAEGGWILGVRDEGTRDKPIEIDQDVVQERPHEIDDSDSDMEEVEISAPQPHDPDLRDYRREVALNALAEKYSPKKTSSVRQVKVDRRSQAKPLFSREEDDVDVDPELSLAIQESLEMVEDIDFQKAIEASKKDAYTSVSQTVFPSNIGASSSRTTLDMTSNSRKVSYERETERYSDGEDLYVPHPTRLETALSIAGASPSKTHSQNISSMEESLFGAPSLLLSDAPRLSTPVQEPVVQRTPISMTDSEDDFEEVQIQESTPQPTSLPAIIPMVKQQPEPVEEDDSDDDMEEILPPLPLQTNSPLPATQLTSQTSIHATYSNPHSSSSSAPRSTSPVVMGETTPFAVTPPSTPPPPPEAHPPVSDKPAVSETVPTVPVPQDDSSSDEEELIRWSKTPSPVHGSSGAIDESVTRPENNEEGWDAAEEMDPQAEEGEYARFMSQVRGKDLDTVRKEIDDEIKSLNQQRKAAMRDSDDITQQMINQIMVMLRLFGIPYITAPMEAEAQCAELLRLGLVDGIITDDSDVFLFGGARVLKNMFNQSKTVECFLSTDLERELGLDRDKLVRLAYLLGSDYTEGLPGVGPVVAMELLTEFNGMDGLHKFREWWRKVQSGKDTTHESSSKFRKRFKKRFKDLFLPEDWPNPAVRDAYYHPTVDSSEEPFKWGMPDLDALRSFFNSELGWSQSKVDDLLLPIIQKMNKRSQQGALARQGNLNTFFDVPTGGAGAAPRKRQVYTSKRLQQVVSDFRKQQRAKSSSASTSGDAVSGSSSEIESEGQEGRPTKKRRKNVNDGVKGKGKTKATARGRGKGRGKGGRIGSRGAKRMTKDKSTSPSGDDEFKDDENVFAGEDDTVNRPLESRPVGLRPRPRPAYRGKRSVGPVDVEEGEPAEEQ
ncbi:hypothetical protein C8Q75DRAFT_430432 [Abortiporus biennis]|nr:hypothetical protein C8Q75DRAFT_430432 [Abortiporus biennis]